MKKPQGQAVCAMHGAAMALLKEAAKPPSSGFLCRRAGFRSRDRHGKRAVGSRGESGRRRRQGGERVPAFNIGSLPFSTDELNNGLGLMINGVQHAYAVATHCHHAAATRRYCIGVKFVFYDVFGLDDDDLREYGLSADAAFRPDCAVGIMAWWQVQHQFGYAPPVTRIALRRAFEADAI